MPASARRFARALVALPAWVIATQAPPGAQGVTRSSDYLYLWTASADSTRPDFLAVVDVRPAAGRYGTLVATVPVPGRGNRPHHTEHAVPADGRLFANGFETGQTFIFDLADPARPKLDGQFGDVAGLSHPHSYLRLPNGHVLATFQMRHGALGTAPGGLVELTDRGRLVRSASADAPGVDSRIRPYSAAVVPALDRIVSTTTDMHGDAVVQAVQVWRLSDLALLATFDLPHGPRGDEGGLPAEPRLLADGRTVLVSTFDCGLYLLGDLAGARPSAKLVSSFPRKDGTYCALPAVAGHYYLVTVPAYSAVVSLDVSDPAAPREVSRMTLGRGDVPHWLAIEPNHRRVVVTGYAAMQSRVVIGTFDERTGALAIDPRFRDVGATEPGMRLDGKAWPHGGTAAGVPHGALFSTPPR